MDEQLVESFCMESNLRSYTFPENYTKHFFDYKTNQDKSKHKQSLQYPSYSLRLGTGKNIHHIKMSISIIAGSTSIQKKQKQLQELQKVRLQKISLKTFPQYSIRTIKVTMNFIMYK